MGDILRFMKSDAGSLSGRAGQGVGGSRAACPRKPLEHWARLTSRGAELPRIGPLRPTPTIRYRGSVRRVTCSLCHHTVAPGAQPGAQTTSPLYRPPLTVRVNDVAHRIGREIELARPSDCAVFDADLVE